MQATYFLVAGMSLCPVYKKTLLFFVIHWTQRYYSHKQMSNVHFIFHCLTVALSLDKGAYPEIWHFVLLLTFHV